MADTEIAKPEPTIDELVNRHLEELDEEIAQDRSIWSLLKDGKVTIQNESDANAVGRAIVQAQADLERVRAIAQARTARAEAKLERLHYVFRGPLTQWTQAALKGKKKRSLILEDAMLQLRAQAARVVTESQPALTEFVERSIPEALSYVPKVSIEAVKVWEEKAGKLAPGRILQDASESLYVKVPKDKEE